MKAAFYESDITPPLGCYITGYGVPRYAEDVHTKLSSKAVVFEDGGKYSVIISVDICEYPHEMHDIVTKRIFEFTGITSDNVCIHSTHSHCGAPVWDDPAIDCYGDPEYKNVFYRLVADSAILAHKRLEESEIYFSKGIAKGIANNRCWIMKDGTMKTFVNDIEKAEKPLSPPDEEVSILFVEQNGKKVGAIYSFGCHQDTTKEKECGYSGDYSAIVSRHLKEKYGHDFVALYLAGPCGDINHIKNGGGGEQISYKQIGEIISNTIFECESEKIRLAGSLSGTKEPISIKKRKYSSEEFINLAKYYLDADGGGTFRLSNLVFYHQNDKKECRDLYVQVISIGDFVLFVYPGEMFVEYSHRTKKESPFKYTMVTENSNGHGGYIPTPNAFSENSYLYEISPAYDSDLVPEAGEILLEKIMKIANKLKEKK